MERVYTWVVGAGYPKQAADWLRRRRLPVIVALGILAWVPVILLGWLLSRCFGVI